MFEMRMLNLFILNKMAAKVQIGFLGEIIENKVRLNIVLL
jgi:hypothetical protein